MSARALVLLLVVLSAASAFAREEPAVRELDHDMAVATWTADTVWFRENLADDFSLIGANGVVKKKADVIRELVNPAQRMLPYESFDIVVRVYGDAAVVTGRFVQRIDAGVRRLESDVRYTHLWIKRSGKWLLVASQQTNVKEH
ncbi:MAG TPA: nuclear transport factor 2 family protein [Thermoanaerobaculia bacterium]|nr:nuclear transport factor 2 family protein [Thermoanaerobaculia bacterium]